MLDILKPMNLGLRFFLELCVLAALANWGYYTARATPERIGLAIGAPLLAAAVWVAFGAPGSPLQVGDPVHLVLEVVLYGAGAVALVASGHRSLAVALPVLAVLNRVLMAAWGQ